MDAVANIFLVFHSIPCTNGKPAQSWASTGARTANIDERSEAIIHSIQNHYRDYVEMITAHIAQNIAERY